MEVRLVDDVNSVMNMPHTDRFSVLDFLKQPEKKYSFVATRNGVDIASLPEVSGNDALWAVHDFALKRDIYVEEKA